MIGNRSLLDNTVVVQTITPATYNDSDDGVPIDLKVDPGNSHSFQVSHGAFTDGSHAIHFEESENGSTWAAIEAQDLDGFDRDGEQKLAAGGQTLEITDATKDGTQALIAYFGGQDFLRARRVSSGTTGALYGVNVVKAGLRFAGKNAMLPNWNLPNVAP